MRYIAKKSAPASFEDWKSQCNINWQPEYKLLPNPQKGALRIALLEEQGYTCCYCGCAITEQNSHIEHFKPQSRYRDEELNYINLHASCESKQHCGHAKGNQYTDDFISPLEENCDKRFIYTYIGKIFAANTSDDKAQKMIHILKLDHASLNDDRAKLIADVLPEDSWNPNSSNCLSNEELLTLKTAFEKYNKNNGFNHVLVRFIDQLLPAVD